MVEKERVEVGRTVKELVCVCTGREGVNIFFFSIHLCHSSM